MPTHSTVSLFLLLIATNIIEGTFILELWIRCARGDPKTEWSYVYTLWSVTRENWWEKEAKHMTLHHEKTLSLLLLDMASRWEGILFGHHQPLKCTTPLYVEKGSMGSTCTEQSTWEDCVSGEEEGRLSGAINCLWEGTWAFCRDLPNWRGVPVVGRAGYGARNVDLGF